jgi:hypothetical protein
MERLQGNSIKAGRFSRIVGLGLILILLLTAGITSQAFAPRAAAETGVYICPNEYEELAELSGLDNVTNIYTGVLRITFKNIGYVDAQCVTANISSAPANVDYSDDPGVTLGDIPAGSSAQSDDTYTIKIDLSNPSGVEEGLTWTVRYYIEGNPEPQYLYMVPQSCDDCIPPVPTEPEPPPPPPVTDELTVQIKNMTIKWARDYGRWGWLKKGSFSIWGRVQLPGDYTLADLQQKAEVTIAFDDSSGNDMVDLQERNLRRLGVRWQYRGNEQPPGTGINIKRMTIWWAPDGSPWAGRAGFYVTGVLELTPPEIASPEAIVTLEIPLAGDGSLEGDAAVTCKVYPRLNRWSYKPWPRLPRFKFDP